MVLLSRGNSNCQPSQPVKKHGSVVSTECSECQVLPVGHKGSILTAIVPAP